MFYFSRVPYWQRGPALGGDPGGTCICARLRRRTTGCLRQRISIRELRWYCRRNLRWRARVEDHAQLQRLADIHAQEIAQHAEVALLDHLLDQRTRYHNRCGAVIQAGERGTADPGVELAARDLVFERC